MKFRTIHIFKMIIYILFTMVFWGCGQSAYEGDGKLYTGFFFYPKFKVTFSKMMINAPIKKIYRFRGAPSDELILRFDILRGNENRETDNKELKLLWEDLNRAKVQLRVNLTNLSSKKDLVGPALLTESWTLAAFGKDYYFWNKDFDKLVLNKNTEYILSVEINTNGNLGQKVYLVPILEGGGFGRGDIYRS